MRKTFFCAFLLWISVKGNTQNCTAPGQTPTTAILVCGNATLIQGTPALCGQTNIPGPCANSQNINPGQAAAPLVVKVTDASGQNAVSGVNVVWSATPSCHA